MRQKGLFLVLFVILIFPVVVHAQGPTPPPSLGKFVIPKGSSTPLNVLEQFGIRRVLEELLVSPLPFLAFISF